MTRANLVGRDVFVREVERIRGGGPNGWQIAWRSGRIVAMSDTSVTISIPYTGTMREYALPPEHGEWVLAE